MKTLFFGMKPAIGWLLMVTFLLVLPGSAFPKETWLSKIQFDKIVHIGVFAILVTLFCRAFYQKALTTKNSSIFILIAVVAIIYGLLMEFVQKNYVPNRSFDKGDLIADAIGAIAGYIFSRWLYLKSNHRLKTL